MTSQLRTVFLFSGALCALAASSARAAITFGQLDHFQDGTAAGWEEGAASPNPPTNIAAGGPRGEGDRFLQNVSESVGPGSRQVMFNSAQWSGDYAAAGVTRVDLSLANLGSTPLHMRLALLTNTSAYGSAQAVDLAPDGVWRRVSFDLTPDGLAKIQGTETLAQVLSHVSALRILSAEAGPTQRGDALDSTLGVDDVRALRLPGDANFDGRVDAADFRVARLNLGAPGGRSWRDGDFDFDGRVTGLDMLTLRRNFGAETPQPAVGAASLTVLPEPAAASVALLGSSLVLRRRRARN